MEKSEPIANNKSALIYSMESGDSILKKLGEPGKILKRKIRITGFISRFMMFLVFNRFILLFTKTESAWKKRRRTAIWLAGLFFPFNKTGHELQHSDNGQIIVINHPTLNDPICAILLAMRQFTDREIIVPVNMPWYESICKYRRCLIKIGVKIVPILTPETAKRLTSDEETPLKASDIQTLLMANYNAELLETLKKKGIAIVAQQATRRRHVFDNENQKNTGENILSTISFINVGIKRAKIKESTDFVPIGVIPYNTKAKPKLNPFRKYTLNIGKPILAANLSEIKNPAKRPADMHILERLAELVPDEYRVGEVSR